MTKAISSDMRNATTPPPAPAEVPLISRDKVFGNPSQVAGRLSPDGGWLSWIAPRDGVLNIYIAPVANPKQASALTNERLRPIREYFWAPDSRQILFINDRDGDENFLLYGLDISSRAQRTFTPFEKTRVQIVKISNKVKDRLLIGINNRDPRWNDVHSLDLNTDVLTPVLMNTGGYTTFLADEQLRLRLVSKSRPDGSTDYFRVVENKVSTAPFEHVTLEDTPTTRPIGFTNDGTMLFWIDCRGRDTAALVSQDVATGRKTVIADDARADISGVLVNPTTREVEAYGVNYLTNVWTPIGSAVKADLEFLNSRLEGEISVISRTDADDKWVVAVDPVTTSSGAYLYERKVKSLARLYLTRPELEGAPLVAMHPVEIKTRDGLTMVSYLTLPPGSDPDGDGRPDKSVPMVLLVHGGPWDRDSYGYNGTHQWLANRGYAVLSPNFRASTGFGKKFLSAGDLQWGSKMHDDLLDATDWAVARGITSIEKVAIMGSSYGGYATLVGLSFTPDRFVCGVEIVGPSNLNTLLETIPPYWQAVRLQFYKRMGDPTTPEGWALLQERSPLFKADQIKRPLLIGQGANDPRVNVRESEQIVSALKARNIPVTYIVFPDEGHGFAHPQNNIAFSAVAENFLAKFLGGRAEPIGTALSVSTAQVHHGAEFAPGLRETLSLSRSARGSSVKNGEPVDLER